MNLKSSSIYIQAAIAALTYNLLHILAWELPIAIRYGWNVNVIGDGIVIVASILGIILIAFRKKVGLILGFIPAAWAIFFQWFLVYYIFGYKEPTGVWWYHNPEPELESGQGLISPSIYLYAIAAFLLVQTGQKFVREMVVGFRQHGGLEGGLPVILLAMMSIVAAGLLIKRSKWVWDWRFSPGLSCSCSPSSITSS
jgi:hypothetical protein